MPVVGGCDASVLRHLSDEFARRLTSEHGIHSDPYKPAQAKENDHYGILSVRHGREDIEIPRDSNGIPNTGRNVWAQNLAKIPKPATIAISTKRRNEIDNSRRVEIGTMVDNPTRGPHIARADSTKLLKNIVSSDSSD